MRSSIRALALPLVLVLLAPAGADAAPGGGGFVTKEKADPAQPSMTRDQALAALVEAEGLLSTDRAAEALLVMVEVYAVLETTDGPEAAGVKELRSWLVKALELLELPDEAAALKARGSYVDHPLSVMPSTWLRARGGATSGSMTQAEAEAAVAEGLGLLERGDVNGLALLLDAYFAIEQQQGPESDDAKVLRNFLVGLLETGGFVDEGQNLRARGSVAAPTPEDTQVYAATWQAILQAESNSSTLGGIDKQSLKAPLSGGATTTTTTPTPTPTPIDSSSSSSDSNDDSDEYKPRVIEKGSPIPSVGIDLGIGSFQPTLGTKGWIWSLGLDVHWTLFRAKFFAMQIGGAGQFGRNRDKRWLTDIGGGLGLVFDFSKIYFIPEFGGGYDGVAGGDAPTTEALRWAPAGYYQFGGRLGVRFAERLGMYGRAVRVNRIDDRFAYETRVRGGFLIDFDEAALDLAFAFTDYESIGDNPSARLFLGVLGFRI